MKLAFFLLTAGFLNLSAKCVSQNVTFYGKNVSLISVFSSIEKQSDVVFVYTDLVLKSSRPVTIQATDVPLTQFLADVFKNQPLIFEISGKNVFVSRRPEPSISRDFSGNATDIGNPASVFPFRGVLKDTEGKPLQGINVIIKGTKRGVITDANGIFTINVNVKDILVISSVEYQSVEYIIKSALEESSTGNSSIVVIVLNHKVSRLDEYVMVGYGTSKRKDLTGSIASVDLNEVKNVPFASIDQALSGKAAGVQVVQADGSPGGVAKIRIRGGTSLIGGNDPLYIIDGVQVTIQNRYLQSAADITNPIENIGRDNNYATSAVGSSFARGLNTLAGLNINDIESIDILKDASATAIYGSRAANGVVIITTKKGKKNEKPILEANYYTGISQAITEKLLSADQYRAVMLEGAKNVNNLRQAQGRPLDPIATSIVNDINFLGSANTDWLSLVTRRGVTKNADLSIRGGGTGSRYYASLAYNDQAGTLKGTDFNRLAGKINLDNEISEKVRVILNLDYGFTSNNITNGIYSSALFTPPTLAPFNPDGSPAFFDGVSFGAGPGYGIQNPMALLEGKNSSKNFLLLGSVSAEYSILKSLKYRSTASVNYNSYHQLNYIPSSVNIAIPGGVSGSQGGIATQGQSQQSDAFFENTLTWDKEFNRHRVNFLVGTSWQQTKSESFTASGQGFPDDKFLNGLSSAALALPPKASETQSSLLSFYLRANYSYKERYLLTVTGRSDASSKFPRTNRVGYFPSAGLAWRASEEKFLKSVKWLNELKFRVSAGYTGTQNIGDNLFYTLFTPASYAGVNALVPTQLGNNKIKWESTFQQDAGVDFLLFNSRLRGAVGYYRKQTSGLLMAYPVSTTSGFSSALVNIADIRNTGLEIDLRADIIKHKNFSWALAANISGNRSRVTGINKDLQDPKKVGNDDPFYNSEFSIGNTVLREGEPVGLIYGYKYTGVIKTQKQLDDYRKQSLYAQYGLLPNLALGYAMYKTIDTGNYKGLWERNVIGKAQPKFYGGITNTIQFKQFSLIALFSFSYGGDLLYLPDVKSLGLGDRSNRNTRVLLNHYSATNPDADRPSLILGETNTYGTGVSSIAVHDASYIKLKSVTLNYELPSKLLTRCGIRTAMLYMSGTNLFCITSYPGPDPEISNDPYSLINGYSDAATYPSMRQFSFGLRVGF